MIIRYNNPRGINGKSFLGALRANRLVALHFGSVTMVPLGKAPTINFFKSAISGNLGGIIGETTLLGALRANR